MSNQLPREFKRKVEDMILKERKRPEKRTLSAFIDAATKECGRVVTENNVKGALRALGLHGRQSLFIKPMPPTPATPVKVEQAELPLGRPAEREIERLTRMVTVALEGSRLACERSQAADEHVLEIRSRFDDVKKDLDDVRRRLKVLEDWYAGSVNAKAEEKVVLEDLYAGSVKREAYNYGEKAYEEPDPGNAKAEEKVKAQLKH